MTYSVLSKNRKPQLSVNECIDHYGVQDLDLNKEKVQEYLDYFHLAKTDLLIESTQEALFALHGFFIDMDAKTYKKRINIPPDQIKSLKFSFVSKIGQVEGEIDFGLLILRMRDKKINISVSDKEILLQATNDLGIMARQLYENDSTATVEIIDFDGIYHLEIGKFSSHEILFKIIEVLAI